MNSDQTHNKDCFPECVSINTVPRCPKEEQKMCPKAKFRNLIHLIYKFNLH